MFGVAGLAQMTNHVVGMDIDEHTRKEESCAEDKLP